jgi:hypothetical protein
LQFAELIFNNQRAVSVDAKGPARNNLFVVFDPDTAAA